MSELQTAQGPVGVFGGTFNPVHYGHLRSAVELVDRLALDRLHLMPSATPPLRDTPVCSAEHRANMVSIALQGEARIVCDERELRRAGPSYTIDSLIEIRGELGPEPSLSMVVGCDALLSIDRWHRWRELLDWAHIVVIARPGWALPASGVVADWIQAHQTEHRSTLHQQPAGSVLLEELRPLDISATEIRQLLEAGKSVRYLMPQSVLEYIDAHALYTQAGAATTQPQVEDQCR